MASQYAGWAINPDGYFAMGSGPLRAKARVEKELFAKLGYAEDVSRGVLVLETRTLPTDDVAAWVARKAGVPAERHHVRRRADGQPRRRRPDRRAFRRDRAPQDGHARFRRQARGERDGHRAAAAGREKRSARDRPDQRLRLVRRPGALHDSRRRRRTGGSGEAPARVGVERLRLALLRHLQALRQRLL